MGTVPFAIISILKYQMRERTKKAQKIEAWEETAEMTRIHANNGVNIHSKADELSVYLLVW